MGLLAGQWEISYKYWSGPSHAVLLACLNMVQY